jgi:hypothetical protein
MKRSAVSTADEPPVVKKVWLRSPGAWPAMRSASTADGAFIVYHGVL